MSAIDYMLRTSNLEMKVNGRRELLAQVVGDKVLPLQGTLDRLTNTQRIKADHLINEAQMAVNEFLATH